MGIRALAVYGIVSEPRSLLLRGQGLTVEGARERKALMDRFRREHSVFREHVRAQAAVELREAQWSATASLGVAALPENAGPGDHLLRAADRALHAAKAAGRKCVQLAAPEDAPATADPAPARQPAAS